MGVSTESLYARARIGITELTQNTPKMDPLSNPLIPQYMARVHLYTVDVAVLLWDSRYPSWCADQTCWIWCDPVCWIWCVRSAVISETLELMCRI